MRSVPLNAPAITTPASLSCIAITCAHSLDSTDRFQRAAPVARSSATIIAAGSPRTG